MCIRDSPPLVRLDQRLGDEQAAVFAEAQQASGHLGLDGEGDPERQRQRQPRIVVAQDGARLRAHLQQGRPVPRPRLRAQEEHSGVAPGVGGRVVGHLELERDLQRVERRGDRLHQDGGAGVPVQAEVDADQPVLAFGDTLIADGQVPAEQGVPHARREPHRHRRAHRQLAVRSGRDQLLRGGAKRDAVRVHQEALLVVPGDPPAGGEMPASGVVAVQLLAEGVVLVVGDGGDGLAAVHEDPRGRVVPRVVRQIDELRQVGDHRMTVPCGHVAWRLQDSEPRVGEGEGVLDHHFLRDLTKKAEIGVVRLVRHRRMASGAGFRMSCLPYSRQRWPIRPRAPRSCNRLTAWTSRRMPAYRKIRSSCACSCSASRR